MKPTSHIGVGVIGMGFIGRMHARAYAAARRDGFPCRVVAVCDSNAAQVRQNAPLTGNLRPERDDLQPFDSAEVQIHASSDELLADPNVQLVSVCTYTDSHVDLAMRALKAGKHVLVEKPVAIASKEVRRLSNVARRAGTLCMPAMCMRFWPGWDWLHDRIVDGAFGAIRSAKFQRMGSRPAWGADFYADTARSGGALVDLHIHDVDFILWSFGRPDAVTSAGSLNHVSTVYRYPNHEAMIEAEGSWDLPPSAPFQMKYVVAFEHASANFDNNRTPRLMLYRGDRSESIQLDDLTGYDLEVRHLITAIHEGRSDLRATLNDAVTVAEILEAERQSLNRRTETAIMESSEFFDPDR